VFFFFFFGVLPPFLGGGWSGVATGYLHSYEGKIQAIKLSLNLGKDGTGTPCLVTWGMRFQKKGKKKCTGPQRGMKLSLAANWVLN
jgi:hypothetical protein